MTQPISAVGSPALVRSPYVEWAPILAGAVGATALAFVLLTFGAAVGLSLTSPWPGSGVSLVSVAIVVGIWTAVVQVASFAVGGYLAGRLRAPWAENSLTEHQFRDGAHGFLVWATGVVLAAIILGMAGAGTLGTLARSGSTLASGAAAGLAGNASQATATRPADYAVDLLLRPAPRETAAPSGTATPSGMPASSGTAPSSASPESSTPSANVRPSTADDARPEVTRIFVSAIDSRAITARDRDYLTQVVARRTGLSESEAQRRVDAAITEARDLEIKARDTADKARKAALVSGFLAAATLLISLAAACAGAALGGRHRDENKAPKFLGYRFW